MVDYFKDRWERVPLYFSSGARIFTVDPLGPVRCALVHFITCLFDCSKGPSSQRSGSQVSVLGSLLHS